MIVTRMNAMRIVTRSLFIAFALLLAGRGDAQSPQAAVSTYIVVLKNPRQERVTEPEPDVRGLGGELVHKWANNRVVRIPDVLVERLSKHPAVKYLQRVTLDGRPLPRSSLLARIESNNEGGSGASTPVNWFSGDYQYDSSGNIRSIGAAVANSDGQANWYLYDTAGRLVSATVNHQRTRVQAYEYDAFGNLVKTQTDSMPAMTVDVDPSSSRVQGETYDLAGNQSTQAGDSFQHDPFNMMRAKVGDDLSQEWYIYTAEDERIGVLSTGASGGIRWTIRDFQGQVLREFEGPPTLNENVAGTNFQTETWKWVEDYVYQEGQLVAAERQPELGGRRHFHLDHLGTPRLITNQAGLKFALHDYFAYGVEETSVRQEVELFAHDRPDPKKYTAHERDFTVGTLTANDHYLDYMHARYYNPSMGRFLSVDPLLGSMRPRGWSRYAYVLGNPVNYTDPWGLEERQHAEPMQPGDTCTGGTVIEGWCIKSEIVNVTAKKATVQPAPMPQSIPRSVGLISPATGKLTPCAQQVLSPHFGELDLDAVTIHENSSWLRERYPAMTFGDHIYLKRGGVDISTIAHELAHVAQYGAHGGVLMFLDSYTANWFKNGFSYDDIPQEKDAYDKEAMVSAQLQRQYGSSRTICR